MEKNEFNDDSKTNNNNKNKAINVYCVCVPQLGPRTEKVYHVSVIPTQHLFWYFLPNK